MMIRILMTRSLTSRCNQRPSVRDRHGGGDSAKHWLYRWTRYPSGLLILTEQASQDQSAGSPPTIHPPPQQSL